MTITIREIKENIFYVNEKQKESKQGIMVRKVTVGNFNTNPTCQVKCNKFIDN